MGTNPQYEIRFNGGPKDGENMFVAELKQIIRVAKPRPLMSYESPQTFIPPRNGRYEHQGNGVYTWQGWE